MGMRLPGPPNRELQTDPRGILKDDYGVIYDYDVTFDIDIQSDFDSEVHGDDDDQTHDDNDDGFIFVAISKSDDHSSKVFEYISSQYERICVYFRVYDPAIETVPRFDSTIYRYLGLPKERAPKQTTHVIIDSTVTTIQSGAFRACKRLKTCDMHDGIQEIGEYAFDNCQSIKTIKLSMNLTKIGDFAFNDCTSLHALFIPPSIQEIGNVAFGDCTNMKILSLPQVQNGASMEMLCCPQGSWIGENGSDVIWGCERLFHITHIDIYKRHEYPSSPMTPLKNDHVHESLVAFYRSLPPLDQVCLDSNVTTEDIVHASPTASTGTAVLPAALASSSSQHQHHGGMTPLHILVMNPYATTDAILACLELDLSMVFVEDDTEMCPLDYLWECGNVECIIAITQVLSIHREAY